MRVYSYSESHFASREAAFTPFARWMSQGGSQVTVFLTFIVQKKKAHLCAKIGRKYQR